MNFRSPATRIRAFAIAACFLLLGMSSASGESRAIGNGEIDYSAGLLSLDVQDIPLSELLHSVGDLAGFPVYGAKDLADPVRFRFHALALDDAVRYLLGDGASYLLIVPSHNSSTNSPDREPGLWILAKGEHASSFDAPPDRQSQPTPQQADSPGENSPNDYQQALDLYAQGLAEELPDQRKTAIESVSTSDRPRAWVMLEMAVRDPEPDLRLLSLEILSRSGEDASIPAIVTALDDPDASVREAAAKSLLEIASPVSLQGLASASNHADPKIRELALEATK